MADFIIIGANTAFSRIECSGDTLRQAISYIQADILRQAIAFPDPTISCGCFDISIRISRLLLPIDAADPQDDEPRAHFVLDVAVEPKPKAKSGPELVWYYRRYKEGQVKKSFMVYGDDTDESGD